MADLALNIADIAKYILQRRFDVPAMVHKFEITGSSADSGSGEVTYRSARVNAGTEAHVAATGAVPEFEQAGTFAQPAGSGLVGRTLGECLRETFSLHS